MVQSPTVVGLGEVLWDLFPSGRRLGGAPANFAYCSHLLGNRAIVASRVGSDELGNEIRESLASAGLTTQYVQVDTGFPTGTVQVQFDDKGQPKFEITHPAAWDFLEWMKSWHLLAQSTDAVCFGSLAQRSLQSRETILTFLENTRQDALRIFDVNLRQSFYSREIVNESLTRSNVVKLNHDELPKLRQLLGMNAASDKDGEISFCRALLDAYDLHMVCVTRGANGSLLCSHAGYSEHPGFRVPVKDTVGAGDAFTAGLVHVLLRGGSLDDMNDLANRTGAWVASRDGAMPPVPEGGLDKALAKL